MSFSVIPVIDLMGGQVVHARRGERENYRPIASALCAGSDPLTIAGALLNLAPFAALYIADLDAIRGRGHHLETVRKLVHQFPGIEFWIDGGFADARQLTPWQGLDITCVIGSESQRDGDGAEELIALLGNHRAVLSLDFHSGKFLGPAEMLDCPELWPSRVIAMNLARVGSDAGPDITPLESLRSKAPACQIFAAGGVRHAADLHTLKSLGTAGALVATALHDGRIAALDLQNL